MIVLLIIVASIVGVAMSAMTAAMNALSEELLMAVRDEGGPDAIVAARVLDDQAWIRARLLAGRVFSLVCLAGSTAALFGRNDDPMTVVATVGLAGLGYGLLSEIAQTFARGRARVYGLRLMRWFRPLELLFVPLAVPIRLASGLTEHLFPPAEHEEESKVGTREVEHFIERHEEEGTLPEEYARLLLRVLEFKDTIAREVMVPRTRMIAIDVNTPAEEVVGHVVEEGHSRYPVYRERVDRIEGILHAKDLFKAVRERQDGVNLASIIRRPVLFVAESQLIGQVLREMQANRQHLAVVVDEFGGTAGIVTLEDIVEEIVGEIQDEHDNEEALITELEPGAYLVDAQVSIHDLGEALSAELTSSEESESLGGLVVGLAGRVPDVGEQIKIADFDLIVREADERHVTRVEIRRRSDAPEAAKGAA